MSFCIIVALAIFISICVYNKTDDEIIYMIKKDSYNLRRSTLFIISIVTLAIFAGLPDINFSFRIICGTIFVFMIPKFIHIVSTDHRILRCCSLLLEFSSAYFLSSNIISHWNNLGGIDYSTISFIGISFIAMLVIEYESLKNHKKDDDHNMNIGKEINQFKKSSKESLNKDINKLATHLNDMNSDNNLTKNELSKFKDLVNSDKVVKSRVKNIIGDLGMKFLGLKK